VLLNLPADLTAREIAGAGVGGGDAIIGVNIDVGPAAGHGVEQVAQRVPRQRADQIGGGNGPLRQHAIEPTAARDTIGKQKGNDRSIG
jgi:hypothetical protein